MTSCLPDYRRVKLGRQIEVWFSPSYSAVPFTFTTPNRRAYTHTLAGTPVRGDTRSEVV